MDQTERTHYIETLSASPGSQMIPVSLIGPIDRVDACLADIATLSEMDLPAITSRDLEPDHEGLVSGIAWIALSPEHATRDWVSTSSHLGRLSAMHPVMFVKALVIDEDDARATLLTWSGGTFEGEVEMWSNTPEEPADLASLIEETGFPGTTYLWTGRAFGASTFGA